MGRRSYKLNLNGVDYKLRITLAAQKNYREHSPETPVLAAMMAALDDPLEMEFLLTQALNWDGNENKIHSGAELYDEIVDAGYAGNEDFLKIILGIAHNAGLISEEERKKVEHSTLKLLREGIDSMFADGAPDEALDDPEGEEGEESPENPHLKLQTLDG